MNQIFLSVLLLTNLFNRPESQTLKNSQLSEIKTLVNNLNSKMQCKDNNVCEFCVETVKDLQMMLSDDFVQTVLSSVVCQYFPYQSECIQYMKEFLQEFVEADSRYVCEVLYMCD